MAVYVHEGHYLPVPAHHVRHDLDQRYAVAEHEGDPPSVVG